MSHLTFQAGLLLQQVLNSLFQSFQFCFQSSHDSFDTIQDSGRDTRLMNQSMMAIALTTQQFLHIIAATQQSVN